MGIFQKIRSYFRREKSEENQEIDLLGKNFPSIVTEVNDINLLQRKRNRTNQNLEDIDERFNNRLNDLERRVEILENNIINNIFYSYEVVDPDLRGIINCPKGVQNLIEDLVLKNNGNQNWPENSTKLRIDRNETNFRTNFTEANIGFLGVGQQKKIKLDVDIIDKLEENKYRLALDFCVNGRAFGNKIYINFQIIEDKISDMRAIYEIPEELASNTCIIKELKNNNGDFAKTYNNIIYRSVNNTKEKKKEKKN